LAYIPGAPKRLKLTSNDETHEYDVIAWNGVSMLGLHLTIRRVPTPDGHTFAPMDWLIPKALLRERYFDKYKNLVITIGPGKGEKLFDCTMTGG